jgi:hypothetical protein
MQNWSTGSRKRQNRGAAIFTSRTENIALVHYCLFRSEGRREVRAINRHFPGTLFHNVPEVCGEDPPVRRCHSLFALVTLFSRSAALINCSVPSWVSSHPNLRQNVRSSILFVLRFQTFLSPFHSVPSDRERAVSRQGVPAKTRLLLLIRCVALADRRNCGKAVALFELRTIPRRG